MVMTSRHDDREGAEEEREKGNQKPRVVVVVVCVEERRALQSDNARDFWHEVGR
jgi:hypothetical protein